MAQMLDRVLGVISKSPHQRRRTEIEVLLPWLRKKSDLLAKAERDVLINLVTRCTYRKKRADDVIITQGEIGDSFYIILLGKCSVYIDPVKTGEVRDTAAKPPQLKNRHTQLEIQDGIMTADKQKTMDRDKYGKFISTVAAGQSFGEIALLSADSVRNASIIADEETDLLVIERELFKDTLEAKQKEEYEERATFVNKCPLFCKWTPRFKRLLEMSLFKIVLPFGATIVKQGEAVNGLFFITKGEAKIIVDSSTHETQFARFYDPSNSVLARELGKVFSKKTKKTRESLQQEQIRVRRSQGYAAAERRLSEKATTLCFVDETEVIGDTELVLGLDTYMQSVVCTANTQLFLVDSKSIDRLIMKKHPHTLHFIRDEVENHLKARSHSKLGSQIQLYPHLLEALELMKPRKVLKPNKMASEKLSREQKIKEQTLKQLVNLYLKDRCPLIEPYVPGAVYYKTKSAQKARAGPIETVSSEGGTGHLRLDRARRSAKRQPRSRRELERLTIAQDPEEISKLQDRTHAVNRFLQREPSGTTLPRPKSAMTLPTTYYNSDPIFELTEPQLPDSGDEVDLTDLSEDEVKKVVINLGDTSDTTNATRARVICTMMERNAHQSAMSKYKNLVRPTSAPPASVPPASAPASRDYFEDDMQDVFDEETSDDVLKELEVKLQAFYKTHSQQGQSRMIPQIQRLKRFQITTPDDVPVPGGTVFVRQRACKYPPGSQISSSQHQHIRRFLIPKDAYAVATKSMALIEKALQSENIRSSSLRPSSAPSTHMSTDRNGSKSVRIRPKTATTYRY